MYRNPYSRNPLMMPTSARLPSGGCPPGQAPWRNKCVPRGVVENPQVRAPMGPLRGKVCPKYCAPGNVCKCDKGDFCYCGKPGFAVNPWPESDLKDPFAKKKDVKLPCEFYEDPKTGLKDPFCGQRAGRAQPRVAANPTCPPGQTWTQDLGCVSIPKVWRSKVANRVCPPGMTWTQDLGCVVIPGRPVPKFPSLPPAPTPRGRRCPPGMTWTQDLGCVNMQGGAAPYRGNPALPKPEDIDGKCYGTKDGKTVEIPCDPKPKSGMQARRAIALARQASVRRRSNPNGACCEECARANPAVTCSPCAMARR